MKAIYMVATAILFTEVGHSCSVSFVRQLWSKKPGAESSLFAFERAGRVGFIDSKGHVVIEPTLPGPIHEVGDFANGLARVGREGFIDRSGKWAIQGQYRWIEDFSDGLALVTVDGTKEFETSSMYIDRTGAVQATTTAYRTGTYSEGFATYEAKGKPPLRVMKPGYFDYRDYPGLKGFIDRTGKLVVQPVFADVGPFVDGLARAALDGYCHLATTGGGREGTPTTGYPSSCGGAPADAVVTCRVGFIDPSGAFAIQPTFESALDFREGLAAVRLNGRWGFIDTRGQIVIPPQFEAAEAFHEGLAAVRVGEKWGFIEKEGSLTIRPRYDSVGSFSDGLAVATVNNRISYVDTAGRTRLSVPYKEVTPFSHGLAAVLLDEHRVAYIDKTGAKIFTYRRQ
jgi:hypothetical protein